MIRALREYLNNTFAENENEAEDRSLKLACTVLMFEVLRADMQTHPEEIAKIRAHVCRAFEIDQHEADLLMQQARRETEHSVSLHEVIRAVNEEYDAPQKRDLIRMLWDVAYADGELDRYEEHTIRKLADRLHVPHRDFIRSKHQAAGDG